MSSLAGQTAFKLRPEVEPWGVAMAVFVMANWFGPCRLVCVDGTGNQAALEQAEALRG